MIKRICRVFAVFVLVSSATDALAACLPDPPTDGAEVVCDGADSTGYDASGATDLDLTTDGVTVLDDSDPVLDSAILISSDNDVTIGDQATINVTEVGGFGIRGIDGNTILLDDGSTLDVMVDGGVGVRAIDDNFVDALGTITIDGDDARGVWVDDNTTGMLPNGARNSGLIIVNGDRSHALETGFNSGVTNSGTITLNGSESRGISAADRTDLEIPANVSNTGILDVVGDDAIGIAAGDGWFFGSDDGATTVVTGFGIFNSGGGRIDVSGARAIGIRAGDPTNLAFDNNSFVANLANSVIDVSGVDAIGVSMGGNDLLDPFELVPGARLDAADFINVGTIMGNADSGPLVEFRGFVAGRENRLLNTDAPPNSPGALPGQLLAAPNRLAIRGSDGAELIFNAGVIEGHIELNDGDDRYVHIAGATMDGTIFGGAGTDELTLYANETVDGEFDTFDVSTLDGFERIQIQGGLGWALENAAGFTGETRIVEQGLLHVPTALTLGGDFSVDPTGTLEVTLRPGTPSLTVQGAASFDGTLDITPDDLLTPSPTPYRVILANGGATGTFTIAPLSGINRFTPTYDAQGLLVLFEQNIFFAARTDNQTAIAQHLVDIDAAGGASADLQALIDSLPDATGNVTITLNALSPEAYDAHTQIVVEGGRRISNLLLDRPRECEPDRRDPWGGVDTRLPCHPRSWSPWVAAIGGFRSREKFSGHPRYDSQMGGLAAGIDARPLEGLDLTFAISSQRGSLDVARAGKSTITLTDVTGHAAWSMGPVRTQAVVGWGHGFHQDHRLIRESETPFALNTRGNEDHDSDRITLAAEIGAVFEVHPFEIEPLLGADWAWVYQRPIHESGAGGFGIRIASRDESVGSINAGVRLSTVYQHSRYLIQQLEWMDGIWRPSLEVRWRQVLHGDQRDIDARFQGAPDSVPDFRISGEEDDGGAEIGLGVSFTPKRANRLQFDVRYDAFVGAHTLEQNLIGRVMLGF